MWELIRVNKRNSLLLIGAMGLVLLALGYVLGLAFTGSPQGATFGLLIAAVIWLVLTLVSFSSGDQILLAASNAQEVTPEVHPMLFNVVEEMKIAANMKKMPKIYIINDPSPNAFATGRSPESASVAVTAGLLARLNRDELQGVIAHEISHIIHRDILFVTLAGVMLGSIVLLSNVFLRSMFWGSIYGGSRRRYSSGRRDSGGGQALLIILAIVAAILAPIFAQILYFALSRRREYMADAGGARLTRYPEGLASALEKISKNSQPIAAANQVTAPMYIDTPFRGKKGANLFATHPPIEERIRVLRNMTHGATFADYQKSYSEMAGQKVNMVPAAAMKEKDEVPIRQATKESKSTRKQHRELGDIMRKVNGFAFLTCTCGLKMKIPPNYKPKTVTCPRCGTQHSVKT